MDRSTCLSALLALVATLSPVRASCQAPSTPRFALCVGSGAMKLPSNNGAEADRVGSPDGETTGSFLISASGFFSRHVGVGAAYSGYSLEKVRAQASYEAGQPVSTAKWTTNLFHGYVWLGAPIGSDRSGASVGVRMGASIVDIAVEGLPSYDISDRTTVGGYLGFDVRVSLPDSPVGIFGVLEKTLIEATPASEVGPVGLGPFTIGGGISLCH